MGARRNLYKEGKSEKAHHIMETHSEKVPHKENKVPHMEKRPLVR